MASDDQSSASDDSALGNWIYMEPRQRLTYDGDSIDKHGKAHLARSLHSRKLVGILGSGLARSYYMPSWGALLRSTAVITEQKYGEVKVPPALSSHIRILHDRFDKLNLLDRHEEVDQAAFIFHFELIENLYGELHVHEVEAKSRDIRSRSNEIFKAKSYLRSRLKWQLLDLRGRLEIFLTDPLVADDLNPDSPAPPPQNSIYGRVLDIIKFPGKIDERIVTAEQHNRAAMFALLFYKDVKDVWQIVVQHIDKAEHGAYRDALETLAKLRHPRLPIPGHKYPASGVPTKPNGEVVDGAVAFAHGFDEPGALTDQTHWDLHDIIDAAFIAMNEEEKTKYLESILKLSDALCVYAELVKVLQKRARSHHPAHLDPIAILHKDLGIRRFITTNYDAEFDKWLESLDYDTIAQTKDKDLHEFSAAYAAAPQGTRSRMVDPFGNRAEITAYEPGSAPDLFDFGVDTRDKGIHVLHLHGRIRKPESWLVLSEPDYQARYARDGEPRAQNDDAMRLIFNSNPLLFIGLGMSEADILRPLRTYSQADGSLSDRPSIALMPRLDDELKTRAQQSRAMSSYGVFNLYYGEAVVGTSRKSSAHGGDWSPRAPDKEPNKDALRIVIEAVKAVRKFVAETGTEDEFDTKKAKAEEALSLLQENVFTAGDETEGAVRRSFITIEASKQHALDVNHALGMLMAVAATVKLFAPPDVAFERSDAVYAAIDAKERRSLDCLLEGIGNTIFSNFFCARLKRAVVDIRDWQKEWAGIAKPRERFGQTVKAEGPANPVPLNTGGGAAESVRQVIILRDLEIEQEQRKKKFAKPKYQPPFPVAPSTDRFFAGHPSPAIITLRAALTDHRIVTPKTKRLFLLLGDKGDGRGHVFAAMRSPKRFAFVCDWLKITNRAFDTLRPEKGAAEYTSRIPRAFYNLGLSHEVLSVFDRMTQFLQDILVGNMSDEDKQSFEDQVETIANDRVSRLQFIMNRLNNIGKMPGTDRIVICFNHIDNLFNVDGEAKNSQLGKLISLVMDGEFKNAPIDIILFMSHSPLPRIFRQLSDEVPFQALCADLETRSYRHSYIQHLNRLGVSWANDGLEGGKPETEDGWIFTHKLHPMRPVTFALRFFPKVAVALYYLGKRTKAGSVALRPESHDSLVNYTFNADPVVWENMGVSEAELDNIFSRDQEFCSTTRQYMQKTLRDAFDQGLQIENHDVRKIRKYAQIFTSDAIENVSLSLILNHFNEPFDKIRRQELALRSIWQKYLNGNKQKYYEIYDRKINDFECANTELAKKYIEGIIDSFLSGDIKWPEDIFDASYYFNKLYTAVGHNRYCLTIVIAAIDDMIERRLNSFPKGVVELNPVLRFIEELSIVCSGQSPRIRVETTVNQVLLNYKTDIFNSYGTPMAAWPQSFRELHLEEAMFEPDDIVEHLLRVDSPIIFELQENILAALALIGQPVTAACLLGVGNVARSFGHLFEAISLAQKRDAHGQSENPAAEAAGGSSGSAKLAETGSPDAGRREGGAGEKAGEDGAWEIRPAQKRRCIDLVLDLLVHRCLVYRLFPKNHPERKEYHFTVHSSIRRYYLSNMGARNVDYASIDQLTVSIYSSQPNEMPKPSADANRRIRRLIEGLSQYEGQAFHPFADPFFDIEEEKGDDSKPEFTAKERDEFRRLRLRAAFGTMRSFHSVGVVSRFSTYQDEGVSPPELGYFEAHRRRVRWLLRAAYQLDKDYNVPDDPEGKNLNPVHYTFYAEEQVWLWNECGVVSLAQGRVNDAVGLLIQARLTAETFIESLGRGSLHVRINLNLALANIESGNLRDGKELLSTIAGDETEAEVVRAMALGYKAWTRGLQCDYPSAEADMHRAVDTLTRAKRFRAAGLLLIHDAEILADMDRLDEAERAALRARDLASTGAHEDVRQLSLLAYYRIMTRRYAAGRRKADKAQIDAGLSSLYDYARTMNMPRMYSGVALIEAELFMAEEGYGAASESAQRALSIATRYNQELIKINALYLLGRSLLKIGMPEAKELLIRARDLAVHSEYNAKINPIEAVLSQSQDRFMVD